MTAMRGVIAGSAIVDRARNNRLNETRWGISMTARFISTARGRVVTVSVVAGFLISACQGGSTPATSPAGSSSSASATATPTPSAGYVPASARGKAQNVPVPLKPALADQNSKAGLETFTEYWFALLDYGYQTGDLRTWTALTDPNCEFCQSLEAAIDEVYSADEWMVGGKLTTPSVEAKWKPGASTQGTAVRVVQEEIAYCNARGQVDREPSPESNNSVALIGAYGVGGWRVKDLGRLE